MLNNLFDTEPANAFSILFINKVETTNHLIVAIAPRKVKLIGFSLVGLGELEWVRLSKR
jgi:hypothetical protein